MALAKQFSFRLNPDDPTEKAIDAFLSDKPTTYFILEALKLYMKFDEIRLKAIEKGINPEAAPK
jgi:predicted transcriptional regulator